MDDLHAETPADAPSVDGTTGDAVTPAGAVTPAHLVTTQSTEPVTPRRRWILPVVLVPMVLLVVLIVAWVVDSSAGGVPRNVQLAGAEIGGLSEDQLAGRIGELAQDFTATPVVLDVDGTEYATTAGDLGLTVDEEDTAAAALAIGDDTFILARPFEWARSLFTDRHTMMHFQVNAEQVATAVVTLEGDDRIPPTEPTVELVEGAFVVVPGEDGIGINPAEVALALPTAAEEAIDQGETTIRLELSQGPIPPLGTEASAAEAAEAAEALVAEPLEVQTAGGNHTISSDELRSWVTLTSNADGTVVVAFDQAKVADGLQRAFADVEGHPVNASFTLQGGTPVVVPDQPGKVCCGPDSGATILASLQAGTRTVELPLVDGPAPFSTADAEAYGIVQAVGGNNAWSNGAPTTAGPGFTTYHPPTGSRIINIHRIADLVRGAVIAPGASFSINDHVGKRTAENGFVPAGAISNGEHVDEIGGGISQFATTTFNAVYFAGLQIDVSQAHSEYFDRYPRGREATMGYPAPDLQFTNDTPYGIMIWTSYTQTSLTVTLYSTPYATAEQTGSVEGTSGKCTTVTTTRTITYPDGRTAQDEFRARYRPSGSTTC